MGHSTPQNEQTWFTRLNVPLIGSALSEAFLDQLITEVNNETVTALILVGSYARGNATPFSDIDIIRFVKKNPEPTQQKQYIYRDSRLIGLLTRTITHYRERLTVPEEAIFTVPSLREALILLDKEGAFTALQQEAHIWTWEPLQSAANYYASELMMVQTEIVHKILRALLLQDALALTEMVLLLFSAVTDAVTVQRGILAVSGNTYFRQAQEAVGLDSAWTHYHRLIVGIDSNPVSLEMKGVAALRLYQETVRLLQPVFHPLHRDVIEQSTRVIDHALGQK